MKHSSQTDSLAEDELALTVAKIEDGGICCCLLSLLDKLITVCDGIPSRVPHSVCGRSKLGVSEVEVGNFVHCLTST